MVKVPQHMVKIPRHTVKIPHHMVKIPRHTVKVPHMVKVPQCMVRYYSTWLSYQGDYVVQATSHTNLYEGVGIENCIHVQKLPEVI